jgi:hypothetical protein
MIAFAPSRQETNALAEERTNPLRSLARALRRLLEAIIAVIMAALRGIVRLATVWFDDL